jgi:hypothetical protein
VKRAPLVLLLLAAGVATAGGDDAVVDGRDWDRSERYAYPVIISAIDGKSYLDLKRRALAPGRHTLEFRSTWVPPARRFVASRELEVVLEPCTVYRYYARHKGAFSSDWELVALPPERLERCGG